MRVCVRRDIQNASKTPRNAPDVKITQSFILVAVTSENHTPEEEMGDFSFGVSQSVGN